MKVIFNKTKFPISPGGNLYHWKKADTTFAAPQKGKYIIGVIASAKNAKQNKSTDDDDLRMELDGYEFGRHERHDEKTSWKGFGTASSWDGASLKGGTKIAYFFLELKKGQHTIKFYADETPILKEIKIWQLKKGESFELKNVSPDEKIDTDKKGISWRSFVFLGLKPKDFEISAICESSTKEKSDGDNIKIVINGKILQSEKAPTSLKYKNFYFSGDLNKGKREKLQLSPNKFLQVENTVELWYDQSPKVDISFKLFDNDNEYLQKLDNFNDKKASIRNKLNFGALLLEVFRPDLEYTRKFLLYSISEKATDLKFGDSDSIAKKIKADIAYNKIKKIVIDDIRKGNMQAEINVEGIIAFETGDLFGALHGLKTLNFVAKKIAEKQFELEIVLFDIYDFEHKGFLNAYTDNGLYELKNIGEDLLFTYANDLADKGEFYEAVTNFDIHITIKDLLNID